MNIKLLLGILSIIPAIIAYYSYFSAMFANRIKPHAFSWLVWGLLSGNGFLAQVHAHGGIGTWATGLTSAASLTISCFAIYRGSTKASAFDWTLLILALTSLVLLIFISNKNIALCLTLFALVAGFAMTMRKGYKKPSEENAKAFMLNTIKFIPAIFALSTFSFLTVAYPLVAALGNAAVAGMLYLRKGKDGTKPELYPS